MKAIVLSVGDELVSGLTVNTNCAWISQQLAANGIKTSAHITVDDELGAITAAIKSACAEVGGCDLLMISGGLGPTADDLTRDALAAALGDKLVEDAAALADLEAFFRVRNRPMTASNRVQALRPESAQCLPNSCGTAPGLAAKMGHTHIFVMPGVPREMKEMFTRTVLPQLQTTAGEELGEAGQVTLASKINTFGLGESALGEIIKDLMGRGANPAVGTTVHDGIVSVRIYATGTRAEALEMTQRVREQVIQRLGDWVYGADDETLEWAVNRLLTAQHMTLATAESCTGGLLAQLVTAVPGASANFLQGWVTYANQAKIEELEVPAELITEQGAVSEPVALVMAQNARIKAGSDLALATTGIAGPDGGTPTKPVGTVWIALANAVGASAVGPIFPGTREQIRLRAAQMALAILRWHLLG
ncbi:MAG: competence/damage-inducible protein A, partial [Phycisphaerae bacterium]